MIAFEKDEEEIECACEPLQYLEPKRSKDSMFQNQAFCGGEEKENYEAKKERNKHQNNYKEVDPPMEREKHKENRVENLGYEDHFQGNQVEVQMFKASYG